MVRRGFITVSPTGSGSVRTITCGSARPADDRRRGLASNVRLASDLSRGRCRGASWGGSTFIWASKGCRGRFEITYAMSGRP
jgi:hypothetical protein